MLLIGTELKHIATEKVYVFKERLVLSWIKVLVNKVDPTDEIQVFPKEVIKEFKKI